MNNILTLNNIGKSYRRFSLTDITFSLSEGCILGLIGPNGAGKTTTIKILMNMIKADCGRIELFGLDHRKNSKQIKNRVGYVGEDQFFYGDKTISWTGKFCSDFYTDWDTNVWERLISDFKLSRTKKTRELSKGMKVKLALALALSHNPELLILDEPTAGLDPIIRREILELLHNFRLEKNKSVIISSHITDDIARIADVVAFLVEGKLALYEEKDILFSQWKRIHYQNGAAENKVLTELKCRLTQIFGHSGITDNYPALKEKLAGDIAQGNVKVENINLDDILIAFVKGEK